MVAAMSRPSSSPAASSSAGSPLPLSDGLPTSDRLVLDELPFGAAPVDAGACRTVQVFVTGGVVSSLGKGITAASLGLLLRARGLSVAMQKLDPYLNVDPGTMNPGEHGECFVTADGFEVDLDLGHYERFVGVRTSGLSSVTSGSVYRSVLERERRGGYGGRTVQVVPHVTDEIVARVEALHGPGTDVVISEVGGTVGDIESLPFLEAARQLRQRLGRDRVCFVHVTLVPTLTNGEQKTKPTQHSVMELRARGISPDVLVARSSAPLEPSVRSKMADMCGVELGSVVEALDAKVLYQVPLALHDAGLDVQVVRRLQLGDASPVLDGWRSAVDALSADVPPLRVALVGKYPGADAYLSVHEALAHAAARVGRRAQVLLVDPAEVADGVPGDVLAGVDAVVVPGGFGERGFEGKVAALGWARREGVPALGICLGMQAMVVEAARELCHLPGAHSSELDPSCEHPVVDLLDEQRGVTDLGGTMRLGEWPARLVPGSRVALAYGAESATERHRHRYEVNPAYTGVLKVAGLSVSGTDASGRLVEYVELEGHPFYVGCQAHPEFTSRPESAHPLFVALLAAAGGGQPGGSSAQV